MGINMLGVSHGVCYLGISSWGRLGEGEAEAALPRQRLWALATEDAENCHCLRIQT